MVTRTTPCLANGAPAAPCNAPEPPTNPPPWIHTITGSLRAFGSAGRQTFRNRQSSDGARGAGAPAGGGGPNRPCMQLAPYSAAWRTPVHGAAGWGGRHRRSPTGGAAKGMPLKETTPSSTTPCTSPLSTRTSDCACPRAAVPTLVAAASAASEHARSLVTLEPIAALSSRFARIPLPLLVSTIVRTARNQIEHSLSDAVSYRPRRVTACPSLQPNRRETRCPWSNRQDSPARLIKFGASGRHAIRGRARSPSARGQGCPCNPRDSRHPRSCWLCC